MALAYDPSLEDFCDILKDYSLSGINFWRGLSSKKQTDVARMFGPWIENDPQQLEHKFSEAREEAENVIQFYSHA